MSAGASGDVNSPQFWRTVDMQKLNIPQEVQDSAKNIQVDNKTVKVNGAEVFYREATPQGGTTYDLPILLAHGMAFSSETWLKLGTLQILAAMGYRTVALDIPGYGKSPSATIKEKGDFLKAVVKALDMDRPVIVSPSMSGYYTLPYMLKYPDEMGGYVPVAPVGIEALENYKCPKPEDNTKIIGMVPDVLKGFLHEPIPNFSCIKVPALVVYGEHDRSKSSALLSLLPLSQAAEIPNGKHPAYLDNPPLWHKLLFNFLKYASQFNTARG